MQPNIVKRVEYGIVVRQAVGAEPVEKALTNLASAAIGESTVTEENLALLIQRRSGHFGFL